MQLLLKGGRRPRISAFRLRRRTGLGLKKSPWLARVGTSID